MKEQGSKRYEVAMSSWFDTHPYDMDKIKKVLKNAICFNVRTAYSLGMRNQPKVIRFSISNDCPGFFQDFEKMLIERELNKAFDTTWVSVRRIF